MTSFPVVRASHPSYILYTSRKDGPLIERAENMILTPTAYSKLR